MIYNQIFKYKCEIEKIFKLVNYFYNGYSLPIENPIIITGSCALLYYLIILEYYDLVYQIESPSDLDLLKIYNSNIIKLKPIITNDFIGNFKLITSKTSSVSFYNEFDDYLLKKFDLTVNPSSQTHFNIVNNINLITLEDLLSFYYSETDFRGDKDIIKINIINIILDRLKTDPKKYLIKLAENPFPIVRQYKINYDSPDITSSKKKLFDLFSESDDEIDKPIQDFLVKKLDFE